MEILLTEEVSRQLYLFGCYEEELSSFLVSSLKPGATFIDAGAHFGYFTLLASALVGSAGQVVAFEPNPVGFDTLTRNVANKGNVRIEQMALWSESGTLSLNVGGAELSAFTSYTQFRLPPEIMTQSLRTHVALTTTLDDYCEDHKLRPNFIKIDVESAESQVLHGGAEVIARDMPILAVEVGDFAHLVESGVPRSSDVLRLLLDWGYRLVEPQIGFQHEHILRDHYEYQTIVALPA
jgi:FkbM family methyltransferase